MGDSRAPPAPGADSVAAPGSSRLGRASAVSTAAASSTLRACTPTVSIDHATGMTPRRLIRP